MKLAQVNLKQVIPGSGPFATACLTAERGFDLTLESGIITAKHKDGAVQLVPIGNVLGMKPLVVKAEKK